MPDFAAMSDDALLGLLRTEEDRLPRSAVDEILRRIDRLEHSLVALLANDAAWREEGRAWWAPVHAVRILAASARLSAFDAVAGAVRKGHEEIRDRIFLEAVEILGAFGIEAASKLAELAGRRSENPCLRVDALHALASHAAEGELPAESVLALAGLLLREWEEGPSDSQELAGGATFVLAFGIARGWESLVLRALGLDRRAARRGYRGLWDLAESAEVDVDNPFSGGSLLDWYAPDAIASRVEQGPPIRTLREQSMRILDDMAAEAAGRKLRSTPAPGRNDLCPCGSGRKFKKCCAGKEEAGPPSSPVGAASFERRLRDLGHNVGSGKAGSIPEPDRPVPGRTAEELHAPAGSSRPSPAPAPLRTSAGSPGRGHFDFEVSLRDIRPRIWRRFLIADTETFLDLHEAIQDAGSWLNCHLFAFRGADGEPIAGLPDGDAGQDDGPFAGNVALRDVFAADAPAEILYEYDFGDSWEVAVRCRGLVRDAGAFQRRLIGGARAFPPEDCGGVCGYEECVEARAAKKPNADQRERLRWLGKWRPEGFDLDKVAKTFDQAKRRRTGIYEGEM